MFIVTEIQTVSGRTATITTAFATLNEADNKYHSVLAAAAVSDVEIHAAIMYTNSGSCIKSECYRHGEVKKEGN